MSNDDRSLRVHVGVLGPLVLSVDGVSVDVPGAKRRAVLALLALADGATVSADELIDVAWPDAPPERARGALHNHVSRVRGHLGPAADRLQWDERGYRLALRHGELDIHAARDGLADAEQHATTDPASAAAKLAAVRALWRGRPLPELDDSLWIAAHRVELTELRRHVDALAVRCALDAGDVDRALRAATVAHTDDPGCESMARLRMQALAAAGRHTEALQLAAELRAGLRDDGFEPSSELIALERSIAAGDLELAAPAMHLLGALRSAAPIPIVTTSIVGRDSEIAAVRRLLDDESVVTIVGTGGVGKTRLAVDVARRHDGDVNFVALAPVTDPEAVPHALAASLGLEAVRGDVLEACTRLLGAGPRLLVLDNCEHVLDRVRDAVQRLLDGCPELTVLATSRQRLGLASECAFRLGPLAMPEATSEHPERAPAVAVFVDRARRARPDFEPGHDDLAVAADIVRRLDGVPLAIELAAGRLSSLAIRDLRDRLDRALDLLGGRRPDAGRHETLRTTIDWSYNLLPADRQRLIRHLSVFPGGVDLATAERVAAEVDVDGDPATAIAHLVDASMLDAELDGEPRYRMLDTVRSFGLDRLDVGGERGAADERLLRWAVELSRWIDQTGHTADEPLADARLRRELANLRAAWRLARRIGDLDTAIEMIVSLDDAAQWRELPEVWGWAHELAADPGLESHPRAAAALATVSDLVWLKGDRDHTRGLAERAVELAVDDDGRWRALLALGIAQLSDAAFGDAADSALRAAAISPRPHATWVAALASAYDGRLDDARAILEGAEPPAGITPRAEYEYTLGEIASICGRDAEAEEHYGRAIQLASCVGSSFAVGIASVGLLTVLRRTGRHTDALRGYRDVLTYWVNASNWLQVWTTLRNLAELLVELGDDDTAQVLLAAADGAPDAPVVGDSAWSRTTIDSPGDGGAAGRDRGLASRDDALAAALDAIDRYLDAM